ncbi:Uncharacterised protein [Mycolicibacterium phlei]|jgi:hypothetical protein|uniref:Uncharacterized protein n=1 Tax=Mycolicibacterium phlei DSM 43239 = CCUG 21000 TaxID=1226750 RepID=A0A5N5USR3_MYCPH|nr:hypothetical protein [Mycolicibacterium phlei]VEG09248.1 Uncharacterised protein [Mycobacteroides chelonae]AMO61133.1 hypothetical protein MPHLCCUG_02320 [Mycolicibacterium phlei]EID08901.1 hypothetical protein MPHLEI_26982 [Mycolicibacterium phlei RIVM601174]KAB7752615.1 hypothetical protein MPHL21000_21885 [Mycolicibacterium phlei DSM 43239 = CCUG 21000]KXW60967.1 hypothetical protein MPHL43239_23660 [Mycolicibacterium phlei DSM 43239 = CCUG 21000]
MSAHEEITYEEFGRRFFEVAVTEERVGSAIAEIAGDEFEIGPIAQGPGGFARVTAKVRIQKPRLTREVGEMITFAIRIPLEIDMMVDLRLDKPKFMVFGEIALRATARAAEPLLLILDVEKPRPSDIAIHVTSQSLRAELVRIIGGIDGEIRRFIAAHVAGEIDSPGAQKAKVIDVGATIDTAWTGV